MTPQQLKVLRDRGLRTATADEHDEFLHWFKNRPERYKADMQRTIRAAKDDLDLGPDAWLIPAGFGR